MLAFLEKLTDVVGLYLNPPQQALVLCIDEKSQIQGTGSNPTRPALEERTLRHTMTHDYKRHGTTTLFAALECLAQGKVVLGQCYKRHRHQEFLKFLRRLDDEFPGQNAIAPRRGQLRHAQTSSGASTGSNDIPDFMSGTSVATSSSWLNLVERWFRRTHFQARPAWLLQRQCGRTCNARSLSF